MTMINEKAVWTLPMSPPTREGYLQVALKYTGPQGQGMHIGEVHQEHVYKLLYMFNGPKEWDPNTPQRKIGD